MPNSDIHNQIAGEFPARLLAWYDLHGRKQLPWKRDRDPYRIWVSEIMLQQTQVATVVPYFERFIIRFPTLDTLATASIDEVLALWAGLGYYARARNLHSAACEIVSNHGGVFPLDIAAVLALPGIGPSTAGAILALSTGARHPILDGNVKRVFTRLYRIGVYPGEASTASHLWKIAERLTPAFRVDDYTQAIMDLGATVCTRSNPHCDSCPVVDLCAAHCAGEVSLYPVAKPKRKRPHRCERFLILQDHRGRVLLERRPPSGIWGGLWSFPMLELSDTPATWVFQILEAGIEKTIDQPRLMHKFTHFDLEIQPISTKLVVSRKTQLAETGALVWHNPADLVKLGMPAPFRKLVSESHLFNLEPE